MKLKDVVKQYREEHGLSQRQFSTQCNMSTGYISMLEMGINPRSKEPLAPSIMTMKKLAVGMGVGLDELLTMLDGSEIFSLSENEERPVQEDEPSSEEFMELFNSLTDENRARILDLMRALLEGQS